MLAAGLLIWGGALLFAFWALWKRSHDIEALHAEMKQKEATVDKSSRLLIEKNIELFDQNISQQKLLASKDDFLAIASHQLRTPATEIKWSLNSLIMQEPSLKEHAEIADVLKSVGHMEEIIEDLLQFVAVEQGHARTATTPYDPDELVREAAAGIAKTFSRPLPKLSLSYADKFASIDKAALEMMVSNLLENAYHYTPEGGAIEVTTKKGDGGSFECVVEDRGMGVPEELREYLFVKFRRGSEAQQKNAGGSGLGLYIVRTLAERVGGSVSYRPREGGGSIFGFVVPAQGKRAP